MEARDVLHSLPRGRHDVCLWQILLQKSAIGILFKASAVVLNGLPVCPEWAAPSTHLHLQLVLITQNMR